jgi:hypothetical protein
MRQVVTTSALGLLICFALSAPFFGQSRGRPQTFDRVITLPNSNAGQEAPASSLAGIVVSEATGEPLAGATVTLTRYFENAIALLLAEENPTASIPPASTDDKGRFSFVDLRGNAYDLTIQLDGYLSLKLGSRDGNGRGGYLTFVPGQHVNDLKVALTKAASLEGRIQTETGPATAGIPLRLFREDSAASVAQTSTAADGTWRLTDLAPGPYVLFAGYPTAANGERPQSFVAKINVLNTDPQSLDFSLNSKGGFAIHGRLRGNGTRGLPMDARLTIAVMEPIRSSVQAQAASGTVTYDSRNGTFEILGLFPGVYVISARGEDAEGGCATAIVSVSSTDVTGFELPLKPCGV